jgi:phage-related minor tail protein
MEFGSNTVERRNVEISGDASSLRQELKSAASLGKQFSSAMVGAFQDIATKSKSVGDALRSLALRLSDLVLKAAFKPLEQGLSGLFSGLFSGAGIGFAKGGVFQGAMPVPFAQGGVIRSPIAFPLGDGRTGIAGERGPEAIMPLTRGSDGSLGVRAEGGAGVTVNFNVVAQDAQSFAKSESQIAAMLARAVSVGHRNL